MFLLKDHYSDVIIRAIASETTDVSNVYSTVCSGADERKHQSSASLAFVRGIHRWPLNSPHSGPVTRKMSPFNVNVIMMYVFIIGTDCTCTSGVYSHLVHSPMIGGLIWTRSNAVTTFLKLSLHLWNTSRCSSRNVRLVWLLGRVSGHFRCCRR